MWIIKIGGSLQDSGYLRSWLDAMVMHGAGRLVVVPGGGRFADAVRAAQRRFGFDDSEAHRRAVLAMEEYATCLHEAVPALVPAASLEAIHTVLNNGGVPLWLPAAMVTGNPGVPASWDVTSDSLALWLAQQLAAQGLVLVKSVAVNDLRPLDELAGEKILDRYFPDLFRQQPVNLAFFNRVEHAQLGPLLDYGVPRRIVSEA